MKISRETKRLDKQNIIILIDPWRYPGFCFNIIKKAIPENYGYIHYSYSGNILNSNPELSKKYFQKLLKKIETDLKKLKDKKRRSFFMYGQSLGGVFAMITASKIKMSKVALALPGDNLADCFWRGLYTRGIRKSMEKKGITLEELKKAWTDISPDSHIKNNFLKTNFYIELSRIDNAIPYKNGLNLIKLMEEKKVKYQLHKTTLDHNAVIIKEDALPNLSLLKKLWTK